MYIQPSTLSTEIETYKDLAGKKDFHTVVCLVMRNASGAQSRAQAIEDITANTGLGLWQKTKNIWINSSFNQN